MVVAGLVVSDGVTAEESAVVSAFAVAVVGGTEVLISAGRAIVAEILVAPVADTAG